MSDIELIRLCAEAMGYSVVKGDGRYKNGMAIATEDGDPITNYDPLAHDAQAMALVKKYRLTLRGFKSGNWLVWGNPSKSQAGQSSDLNRAICEAIAKLTKNKNNPAR